MINPETIKSCRESLNSTVERLTDYLERNPLAVSESDKEYERGGGLDAQLVKERNHSASKAMLEACQAALKRMDDGTWEFCVKCGKPIEEDRRIARPEASNCKPCQEKIGLRVC